MLTKEEIEDTMKGMTRLERKVEELKEAVNKLKDNQCTNCRANNKGRDYMYGNEVNGEEK